MNQTLSRTLMRYFENPNNVWQYGNSVLYNMCAQEPYHNKKDVIIGKLWLIGRSYSAALERRKTGDGCDSTEFYADVVAPKMLEIGDELDRRIGVLKEYDRLTDDNLDSLLSTHMFLTDVFNQLTKLDKRSLASKYLHFHSPNAVYIYDSRASNAIRKVVRKNKYQLYKHYSCGCDTIYADFCVRALNLQELVSQKYGRILSCREIDDFLLYYID